MSSAVSLMCQKLAAVGVWWDCRWITPLGHRLVKGLCLLNEESLWSSSFMSCCVLVSLVLFHHYLPTTTWNSPDYALSPCLPPIPPPNRWWMPPNTISRCTCSEMLWADWNGPDYHFELIRLQILLFIPLPPLPLLNLRLWTAQSRDLSFVLDKLSCTSTVLHKYFNK